MDEDEDADVLGDLPSSDLASSPEHVRKSLFPGDADRAQRYSQGGTAVGVYDRFSTGEVGAYDRFSSGEPHELPAATRTLLLEEKCRESERQVRELRRVNGLLREAAAPPTSASASTQTADEQHPCFGRLLCDLGSKRLYLASARTLVNSVPIWAQQRACNEERVDQIVRAKRADPSSLMGTIMAFEFPGAADGSLALPSLTRPQPRGIFDGQHRARAAMRLLSSDDFVIQDDDFCTAHAGARSAPAGVIQPAVKERGARRSRRKGKDDTEMPSAPVRLALPPLRAPSAAEALPVPPTTAALTTSDGVPPPPPAPPVPPYLPTAFDDDRCARIVAPLADGGMHDDFSLLVEVYPVRTDREIKELYLEVNKGESVKEIDLPDALAPSRKAIIDEACMRLKSEFAPMFKPSERCRAPHLHLDTLRNKLFHCPAVEHVASAEDLYARMLRANGRLSARPPEAWPERLHKPLEKALAHGLLLGLDGFEWLEGLEEPRSP